MSLVKILKPDFTFSDDRGNITQICSGGYRQINSVFSKKGAVRGSGHYHKYNSEAFFIVSGQIELRLSRDGISEKYIFSGGDMFEIAPETRHSFLYLADTYLVGLYSGSVILPDGTKDIFTD